MQNFQNMFQKCRKCSKLFAQDNCPILNCAKARKALKEVGGELFPIPKRSGDLKPIENVFNVAKEELQTQAIRLNLTYENFEDFTRRVKSTLYSMRRKIIQTNNCALFLCFNPLFSVVQL